MVTINLKQETKNKGNSKIDVNGSVAIFYYFQFFLM